MFSGILLNIFFELLQSLKIISKGVKFKKLNYRAIIHNNNGKELLKNLDMAKIEFLSSQPTIKKILDALNFNENNKRYDNSLNNMIVRDYVNIFILKKELIVLDYATYFREKISKDFK